MARQWHQILKDTFVPLPPQTVKRASKNHTDTVVSASPQASVAEQALDYYPSPLHEHSSFTHRHPQKTSEKHHETEKADGIADKKTLDEKALHTQVTSSSDEVIVLHQTQRRLSLRMVYLIAFSGVIGTAVFVSMGSALNKTGPLSLFLGFALWCLPVLCITASIGEMVCYLPVPSPFISMAGRCADKALEITAGWNFWFLQAALIPYEVVGVNTIIHYWRNDYSPAIPLVIQIALYFLINVIAVELYGEVEFWLSIGKVLLAVGIMLFTLISMLGGNPQHDRYGFRYWRDPGPMNQYLDTGNWGRFLGVFAAISTACFTVAGPEYVAMTAAEAVSPRTVLPKAFRQMFFRLSFLFLGMCLCMGTVCAYNDPNLVEALKHGSPGAAASPFVIAMTNINIPTLPDIVNGALVVAAFSSGNSYTYTSSRTLYGLAKAGHAPKLFSYCTKAGTPMYAILASLAWSFLSFLQMGENSATVLGYIVSLVTISQLVNYVICCVTYCCFFRALKAQDISRTSLPYRGYCQPWLAIIGGTAAAIMCLLNGYGVFLKGSWDTKTFIFNYIMIPVDIFIYIVAKVWTRGKWVKSEEADLQTGLREVEDYQENYDAMKLERDAQKKRFYFF